MNHLPPFGTTDSARGTVYARRLDGLGGRLGAITGAIRLATLFECDLRIMWPNDPDRYPNQAVPLAEEIFSPVFFKSGIYSGPVDPVPRRILTTTSLGHARSALAKYGAIEAPWHHLGSMWSDKEVQGPTRLEFNKIGWNEAYSQLIAVADEIMLPQNTVGLHVRAGDVVYGRYRSHLFHTQKIIPYLIAEEIVERLEGPVLLAGQGERFLRQMRRHARVILARDLLPRRLSVGQQGLGELVLLSRVNHIVARESVYAHQAAALQGAELVDPDDIVSKSEQVSLTEVRAKLRKYPSESGAFSLLSAYEGNRNELDHSASLRILRAADGLDPNNMLYGLLIVDELVRSGRLSDASIALYELDSRMISGMVDSLDDTFTVTIHGSRLLSRLDPSILALKQIENTTAIRLSKLAGLV